MAGGRPPKLFTTEETIVLGEDLLRWINQEGSGTLVWVDWYYDLHKMFRDDWKALVQRPEFLPYYEIARKKMTRNITLNDNIPQSYGNRYLNYYDDELLEHEEGIKDRDASRGKDGKQNINQEQLQILADCFARFSQRGQPSKDIVTSENRSD
jgi:hypothetical protein